MATPYFLTMLILLQWSLENYLQLAAPTESITSDSLRILYTVAVLGTAGPGAEFICGGPCLKIFVNQDYSLSFFP